LGAATVRDVRSHPDDGSTLVLLHPVGLNGGSFSFLSFDDAAMPDLLGHGSRPRSPGMTLERIADDVAANVAGPLHLAGFSFGGMVAIQLALRHPERVRSLLVACAPAAVDRDVILARADLAEAGMEGALDSTLRRWFTPAALAQPGHPGVEYSRASLLALDPLAFADGWRAIAGHDAVDRLHELDLPVTCLAGTHDVSSPPDQVRVIADGVDGARFVQIDAPHIAYLEEPAAVAAVITEHLAGIALR
jgi:3-oxoadipate enol-lactonase